MKIFIKELGSCGINYQTDYLKQFLEEFDLTNDISEADTILMIGGCCCTEDSINQTIDDIDDILKHKKTGVTTYLIGCITRSFKDIKLLKYLEDYLRKNIDHVIEYYEPNKLLKLLNEKKFESILSDNYGYCEYNDEMADIYIQNGCTHNCSFCKTNYLKCDLKDAPIERVKRVIDRLDEENVKKIQLRGFNLSQYGLDLYKEYKLVEICEYIERTKNIEQVMLSGFAFSDAIHGNFAKGLKYLEKTSCINGSLESGSNRILELMKKGFTQEEILRFYYEVTSIYDKEFRLNIISGFPTETIEDCIETLKVLAKIKPRLVNINTYLGSEFVPSHILEQLSDEKLNFHTKLYCKVLKKNYIDYRINGAN